MICKPRLKAPRVNTRKGIASTKIKRAIKPKGNYGGSKEEWQKIRTKVLKRDGYKCTKCGCSRSFDNPLDIHHIRRLSRGGSDSLSNLITLCRRCHSKQDGHSHMRG